MTQLKAPVHTLYHTALAGDRLRLDTAQEHAAQELDRVYNDLMSSYEAWGFLSRLLGQTRSAVKGLYLYGAVGRGKSMLMQFFIDAVHQHNQQQPKNRWRIERQHFHAFMLGLHQQLHAQRVANDAQMHNRLAELADQLADRLDILCFDEFHVTDVTDAMLLMPYFTRLWEKGVVVIATSNFAPQDLYKNGLQRERFVPFIHLLQKNMHVVALNSAQDYRLLQWQTEAQKHDHWLQPLTTDTADEFAQIFQSLVGYDDVQAESVIIPNQERSLYVQKASRHVAWIDVETIITGAVGAADFIALADRFPILLFDQVRPFAITENDRAKRFMLLIDSLYEAGTQLYIRAACAPEDLYPANGRLAFEFARTVSRLQEMRFKQL